MSSAGSATGRPAITRSAVSGTRPVSIRQTSQEVPPMSKQATSGSPASSASSSAPATPPAGPERTVSAACGAGAGGLGEPARGLHHLAARRGPPRRPAGTAPWRYADSGGESAASRAVVAVRSNSRKVPTSSLDSDSAAPGQQLGEQRAEQPLVGRGPGRSEGATRRPPRARRRRRVRRAPPRRAGREPAASPRARSARAPRSAARPGRAEPVRPRTAGTGAAAPGDPARSRR